MEISLQKSDMADGMASLKRELGKKNDEMSFTLGDKRPSYYTVKNWIAVMRTEHLKTEDAERSARPPQLTLPENVDASNIEIMDRFQSKACV
jgi:hypothetical protein